MTADSRSVEPRAGAPVGLLGCIAFAQQHLPMATISVMQVTQPALAVLFAFLILGEEVRVVQVGGMAMVIVGIALFTRTAQRRPLEPTPNAI